MGNAKSTFEQLVYDHLIPEFCADDSRNLKPSGFRQSSLKISEQDASYFLNAWELGLIAHDGRGQYRSVRGSAKEQFFWEGPRSAEPRPFTLWLEPIITVAGLARLHLDFNWPKMMIGTQSVDWAFDLVAFLPGQEGEFIAGEVKKSASEAIDLLKLMAEFGQNPNLEEPSKPGKARNAFKKIAGLRARHPPHFWALGPDGMSRVFSVAYRDGGVVELNPSDRNALQYPFP